MSAMRRQPVSMNAMRKLVSFLALVLAQLVTFPASAQTSGTNDTFPRLGGYQIGGWAYGHNVERLNNISKLDIAVIQLFVDHNIDGYSIADVTSYIKQQNADVKLLQYVIINEVSQTSAMFQEIRDKVASEKGAGGRGDWYARNAAGEHVWEWPGTWMLNFSEYTTPDVNGNRLPQWLADWFSEQYFEVGGKWDGFYIDVMNIEPQVDHDWDLDGDNDSRKDPVVVEKYTKGQIAFHDRFIQRYPHFIGMGNIAEWGAASNPLPAHYYRRVAGLVEGIAGFSWSAESWDGFEGMMNLYRKSIDQTLNYTLFHVLGSPTNYKFMRYTLAACLMDDGYYTHTTDKGYTEQAWFDEFDVDLGHAIDPPQTISWSNGVYRRAFENGIVLVNPRGNGSKTVDIGEGFKRFQGGQDPVHNNGNPVTTLTLADGDGIILLRENGPELLSKPKPPLMN